MLASSTIIALALDALILDWISFVVSKVVPGQKTIPEKSLQRVLTVQGAGLMIVAHKTSR